MLENIVNTGIYGKEPLFEVRKIETLRDMFLQSTAIFAPRTAFMEKPSSKEPYVKISYAQFKEDVFGFGEALIERGFAGKKIALISENRYAWAVTYMAVVCGVGTIVPIDKELTEGEMVKLAAFAECSAIVASEAVLKKNPGLSGLGIDCISIDSDFDGMIKSGRESISRGSTRFENARVMPEDINVLLFTSGTGGNPKGVMLSHKNICSNMMNICSVFKIDHNDRVFSLLPLHHTYECTCGFLCEIYVGASIAYCRGLKYILKNMQESKPTMFFLVPMVIESIYKVLNRSIDKEGKRKSFEAGKKLSKFMLKLGIDRRRKIFSEIIDRFGGRLKMFLVGAAPVNPEIMQFFTDIGITTIQGYGMTECAPIIAENRASHYRGDSVGMPLPELALKICEPDKNGIGEIAVKGDNVMCGYYQNPVETEKVMQDGWFLTGDMGYYKGGFLYLTGRKKNLIITSNGENVFPEELEALLSESSIVEDCMVYQENNVITAQVYPDEAALSEAYPDGISREEISALINAEIKEVNRKLPPYKAIARFAVRKEPFIKTTTKKIKRSENM